MLSQSRTIPDQTRDFIFKKFTEADFLQQAVKIIRQFIFISWCIEHDDCIALQESLLITPISQLIKNSLKKPFNQIKIIEMAPLSRKICQAFLEPNHNQILCENLIKKRWEYPDQKLDSQLQVQECILRIMAAQTWKGLWAVESILKKRPERKLVNEINNKKLEFLNSVTNGLFKDVSVDHVLFGEINATNIFNPVARDNAHLRTFGRVLLFSGTLALMDIYPQVMYAVIIVSLCIYAALDVFFDKFIDAISNLASYKTLLTDNLISEILLKSLQQNNDLESQQTPRPISNKKIFIRQNISNEMDVFHYSDNSLKSKIRKTKKIIKQEIREICLSKKIKNNEVIQNIKWGSYIYKPLKMDSKISRLWSNDPTVKINYDFLYCDESKLRKTIFDKRVCDEFVHIISDAHYVKSLWQKGMVDCHQSDEVKEDETYKAKTLMAGASHLRVIFKPIAVVKIKSEEGKEVDARLHGISRVTNN